MNDKPTTKQLRSIIEPLIKSNHKNLNPARMLVLNNLLLCMLERMEDAEKAVPHVGLWRLFFEFLRAWDCTEASIETRIALIEDGVDMWNEKFNDHVNRGDGAAMYFKTLEDK